MRVNEEFVVIMDFVNTIFILLVPVAMVTQQKVQPQNLAQVKENLSRICYAAKFHNKPFIDKGFIDNFNLHRQPYTYQYVQHSVITNVHLLHVER